MFCQFGKTNPSNPSKEDTDISASLNMSGVIAVERQLDKIKQLKRRFESFTGE